VVVPTPAFPIHIYAAIIAGGNVIRVPLADEEVFLSRIAAMCQAIFPTPKVLMLNYPHNPTSVVATRELFQEIVKLAKRYRFMVVHDFAYAKITFDGYVAPSFLEVPEAREVGVEFGSFPSPTTWRGGESATASETARLSRGWPRSRGTMIMEFFGDPNRRNRCPTRLRTRGAKAGQDL